MGLDSVEIVLLWEESFNVSIPDSEATGLLTPRMAIDLLSTKLNADTRIVGPCLAMRAFHRLRRALREHAGIARNAIRPSTGLRDLIPRADRARVWKAVQREVAIDSLPGLTWGVGWFFTPLTVGELASWIVAHAAYALKAPRERWARLEIREVVRAAVIEVCGPRDFSDDAHFIRDIGID